MMMNQRRLFSCASRVLKNEIVAPFGSQFQGERVSFDKNIPINKRTKAWERDGDKREEWFKRKYAHVHAKSKQLREGKDLAPEGRRSLRRDEENRHNDRYSSRRSNDEFDRPRRNYNRNPISRLQPSPMIDYVFGVAPVMAALKANKRDFFTELLYHNPKERHGEVMKLAKDAEVQCRSASKMELNQLTNNNVHNGYVLASKPLTVDEITRLTEFDPETGKYGILQNPYGQETVEEFEVARTVQGKKAYPFGVYLDEISDPHNVGLIIRTAYYLGADFIVMSEKNCAKLTPVVSKSSSGAMELLPIYASNHPVDFIERSQQLGWKFIGSVVSNAKTNAKKVSPSDLSSLLAQSPCILAFGSEGTGMRTNLITRSNYLVSLQSNRKDLDSTADSLNVSVAAGLLLHNLLQ